MPDDLKPPQNHHDAVKSGQEFIAETHKKMTRIAQEFANGDLNRVQFQHLYDRYQRQILTVAQLIAESNPETWRTVIQEDYVETTVKLKETLSARVIGYSVYGTKSGMPIETEGEFSLDAELIVPMLSSYRSATAEIFQASVQSFQLENGHWLYFLGGQYTTLIVLFSLEPASNQLPTIQQIHHDYETANTPILAQMKPTDIRVAFRDLIKETDLLSIKLKRRFLGMANDPPADDPPPPNL